MKRWESVDRTLRCDFCSCCFEFWVRCVGWVTVQKFIMTKLQHHPYTSDEKVTARAGWNLVLQVSPFYDLVMCFDVCFVRRLRCFRHLSVSLYTGYALQCPWRALRYWSCVSATLLPSLYKTLWFGATARLNEAMAVPAAAIYLPCRKLCVVVFGVFWCIQCRKGSTSSYDSRVQNTDKNIASFSI